MEGKISPRMNVTAQQTELLSWKVVPARLDATQAAWFLGFGCTCSFFEGACTTKIALGISVEDPSLFGILPEMAPRFSEMNKVRVICERFGKIRGLRDGRWIYKISISEDPSKLGTFDNWIPAECLELAR